MRTFTVALSGGEAGGKDAPDVSIEAYTYELAEGWIQFSDDKGLPCGTYPQRSVRSVTLQG